MKRFKSRVARGQLTDAPTPGFASQRQADFDPVSYGQEVEASQLDRLDLQDTTDSIIESIDGNTSRLVAIGNVATRALGHWRIVNGVVTTIQATNVSISSIGFSVLVKFINPIADNVYSVMISDHQDGLSTYFSAARQATECQIAAVRTVDTTAINLSVGTYEFAISVLQVI